MWRTSRTAPMPINARSTAWAARRWPAPADADSTSTLPSSATFFSRCEISVGVRPFSDCNEAGPESEDKRRTVTGCAPWRNTPDRSARYDNWKFRVGALFVLEQFEVRDAALDRSPIMWAGNARRQALQHTRVSCRGTQLGYPNFGASCLLPT